MAVEPMQVAEQDLVPTLEQIPGQEEIKAEVPNAPNVEEIQNVCLNGMDAISNLQRFCYLGSFEPVYIHLRGQYVKVKKFWPIIKDLVKNLTQNDFVTNLVKPILGDSRLVRRHEVFFVYAAYLASAVNDDEKKLARVALIPLIETDEDLFLFAKYCSLIGKEQKQKCFSRTARKAIKAWYGYKAEETINSMWLSHRGLHNFTHKALLKLCRINDSTVGSSAVAVPFFRSCTEIVTSAEMKPEGKNPQPSTSASAKKNASEEVIEKQLVKQKSSPWPTPTAIIVAVSKLRTTDQKDEAIKIIDKFKLPYKYVPGHLLRYSAIMNAVLPTMTYLQILKYWRKMVRFNHFNDQKLLKTCQKCLGNVEFAQKNRIHPIHLLMSIHSISRTNFKCISTKRIKKLNLNYLNKLYEQSFDWPAESGKLRMFITVNLQQNYKKKILKNHKKLTFYDASFALAFGYLKRESHVDVYHWVEDKTKLAKLPLAKTLTTELGLNTFQKIENKNNCQRLVNPLMYGLVSDQVYDVFLCIVPKAGRGNPKQNSDFLVSFLDRYRQQKNPNARFIILDLLKFKPRSMKYSEIRSENILEICGLDEHTTDLIHNFATHRFA